MRKYLFILFTFVSFLHAEEIKIIEPTNQFPLEIHLIFKSIQLQNLSNPQYLRLQKRAYILDALASSLLKEELYFIIKSEVYKAIIKYPPPTKSTFEADDLKNLKKFAENNKDPFFHWMFTALYVDAENLFSSQNYKTYLIQKKAGKIISPEASRVAKKLQLIARFYSKININDPLQSNTEFKELLDQILDNLEEALFLVASESKFDKPKPVLKIGDPYNFFAFKKIDQEQKVNNKKSKTVEDIIDQTPSDIEDQTISSESPLGNLPKPSNEDWLKDDNSPIDIKKLPKPTNDADWLQDI